MNQPDNIWTSWLVSLTAPVFAIGFTEWYPEVAQAKARVAR
jgi:hypothetical protein